MNRREFCQHLALLAAGTAALPQQIAAFERVYDLNTSQFGEVPLISIDEITFGFGGDPRDEFARVEFCNGDHVMEAFPMNTRSTFRWVVLPQSPLILPAHAFHWRVADERYWGAEPPSQRLQGTIRYTDMDGLLQTVVFDGTTQRLF